MRPGASAGLAALILLSASAATAAPDLRKSRVAAALVVFADDLRPHVFYYAPGDLAIATSDTGEPDLRLLHARYTGSAATGDRGAAMVRSIFTVRVLMNGPTAPQLAEARKALAASDSPSIELKPLPIRRVESVLVFVPVGRPEAEGQTLPSGHFEASETAAPPRDAYWTERTYTLGLAAADAQLLSSSLEHGRLALSIGYAFLADGIGPDQPLQDLTGSPALVAALGAELAALPRDAKGPHVVRAGAIAVTADVRRWPHLVQRVDINASAPPGYAALDIYCYDFTQGADSELYEKQIEIAAAGVGGTTVALTAVFSRAQPDLYARSVRFPVAVRLDRPFRFRVVTIAQDGSAAATPWRERASWTELLDVTARRDRPEGDRQRDPEGDRP